MAFISIDSYEKFGQLTGGLASIASFLAVVIGAVWAYRRFIRQEENFPYINFTADINFICKQGGYWVVELISTIENKGKVPHRFSEAAFDLNALLPNDAIELNKEFGNQVFFPHEIAKGSWIPTHTAYFFIAPGATSKYSYIASVPEEATAIMFHSWFKYDDRRDVAHAAERTVRVPSTSDNSPEDK